MASGLIIPVSDGVLGFSVIATIIIFAVWSIFNWVSKSVSKQVDNNFYTSNGLTAIHSSLLARGVSNPNLITNHFPNRITNREGQYDIYWGNGICSLALVNNKLQSSLKVFTRISSPVYSNGRKLRFMCEENSVAGASFSSESAIYSNDNCAFYEIYYGDLEKLYLNNHSIIVKSEDDKFGVALERETLNSQIGVIFDVMKNNDRLLTFKD